MLMNDLTLFIVKRLADKPDAVLIEEEQDGDITIYLAAALNAALTRLRTGSDGCAPTPIQYS